MKTLQTNQTILSAQLQSALSCSQGTHVSGAELGGTKWGELLMHASATAAVMDNTNNDIMLSLDAQSLLSTSQAKTNTVNASSIRKCLEKINHEKSSSKSNFAYLIDQIHLSLFLCVSRICLCAS